jgi:hypothetical protein
MPGAVVVLTRIVAGLTNEKLLLLVVICAFSYMTFSVMSGMAEERATTARRSEESRVLDRQHCDDREDKRERERKEEAREMRQFFAAQAELQRKHDAEREDKTRMTFTERFMALVMELAELKRLLKKPEGE